VSRAAYSAPRKRSSRKTRYRWGQRRRVCSRDGRDKRLAARLRRLTALSMARVWHAEGSVDVAPDTRCQGGSVRASPVFICQSSRLKVARCDNAKAANADAASRLRQPARAEWVIAVRRAQHVCRPPPPVDTVAIARPDKRGKSVAGVTQPSGEAGNDVALRSRASRQTCSCCANAAHSDKDEEATRQPPTTAERRICVVRLPEARRKIFTGKLRQHTQRRERRNAASTQPRGAAGVARYAYAARQQRMPNSTETGGSRGAF